MTVSINGAAFHSAGNVRRVCCFRLQTPGNVLTPTVTLNFDRRRFTQRLLFDTERYSENESANRLINANLPPNSVVMKVVTPTELF